MAYPFFQKFQLDTKSLAERKNTVGGSDINIIASGNSQRIHNLWLDKLGKREPDDLTLNWSVIMGNITEEANIEWIEHQLDLPIIDRQKVIRGNKHNFMRCTLDGVVKGYKNKLAVIDAKFSLGRPYKGEEYKDVIPRLVKTYSPQIHWNAYLVAEETGKTVPYGLLSIIKGGDKPVLEEIKIDPDYQQELIARAKEFMNCIDMEVEPTEIDEIETPIPEDELIPIDMNDNPKWKAHSDQYLQTLGANDIFKKSTDALKKLVPKNASECFGNGIKIKVLKNKSKRIELCNN